MGGGQAGGDARFTAGCAAEFETVYDRCSEFIRGPAARVDASAWEAFLEQCQASTHSDIGSSCEEQCAARYPNEDQQADACACTYGCHASEAGQDAGACLETCDSQCDRGKQCACECGAAGTCSDCTSADQCESKCSRSLCVFLRSLKAAAAQPRAASAAASSPTTPPASLG